MLHKNIVGLWESVHKVLLTQVCKQFMALSIFLCVKQTEILKMFFFLNIQKKIAEQEKKMCKNEI